MSQVKTIKLWVCHVCGFRSLNDDKHLCPWNRPDTARLAPLAPVEYVPATDSPDREPDAWLCPACGQTFTLEAAAATHRLAHTPGVRPVPLYRNPPDRSDGLREALEAVRPALESIRRNDKTKYDYRGTDAKNRDGVEPPQGEGRWLTPRELAGSALKTLDAALAAARLALEADNGS